MYIGFLFQISPQAKITLGNYKTNKIYRVLIYLKSSQTQFGVEGKRFNMEALKKYLLPINTETTVIKYIEC